MFQSALILILVVIMAFLGFAALQPAAFTITRSTSIHAPASAIFPHINNLHQWDAWSPWAKIDPVVTNDFSGPAAGVGASMHWSGNRKVGEGTMTIRESHPSERIRIALDFLRPMKANNEATFTLVQKGDITTATWTMTGRSSIPGRAIGILFNCEKMVGDQFAQGLASLKAIVERK